MLLKKYSFIPLAVILLLVLVFIVVCMASPSMVENPVKLGFNNEEYVFFNEGWKLETSNGYVDIPSLPATDLETVNNSITIVNTVPLDAEDPITILIRASMQSVVVYIEDEVQPILTEGDDTTEFIGKTLGSRWTLVRLPSGSAGKEIKVVLSSSLDGLAGKVSDITLGSKVSNLYYIAETHGFTLVISAFIFLVGAVMVIVYLALGKKNLNLSTLYLGLFIMLSALWIAGESRMLQFFFDNQFYVTRLAYFGLMLFPIPLVMYFQSAFDKHIKYADTCFFFAFVANFVVCLILQLTGVAEFYETIITINILLSLFVVYVIVACFIEFYKYQNRFAGQFLLTASILAVFGIAEFIAFFADDYMYTSKVFSIGILVFVVVLGLRTIMDMRQINEKSIKSDYYSKLAYTDLLTDCKNRNAYYVDTATIFAKAKATDCIWVVMFDLNGLKTINDKHGHKAGDDALIIVAKEISDAFAPFTCYRMGGDEFVCIIFDKDEKYIVKCIEELNNAVENNKVEEISLTVACGYAKFGENGATTFDALSSVADKRMYANKLETGKGKHGATV